MRIALTGAGGFIGARLVPLLLDKGHELRVLAHRRRLNLSCDTLYGALPDRPLAAQLCANRDAVIHAAGLAHVNASAAALDEHNVQASIQLAEVARAQGVRTFIFLSSSKARYPQHSPYARGKAEAEQALHQLDDPGVFDVICLRPALVYGAGMRGNLRTLLRLLARPHLPVFVKSDNPIGLISVEDLCRAVHCALVAKALPGGPWELSDGKHYSLDSLVRDVRAALGLKPPAISLPQPLVLGAALLAQLLAPLLPGSLSMSTYRTLFNESYPVDAEFSRRTGFVPQDSLLARLPDLIEEYPIQ